MEVDPLPPPKSTDMAASSMVFSEDTTVTITTKYKFVHMHAHTRYQYTYTTVTENTLLFNPSQARTAGMQNQE